MLSVNKTSKANKSLSVLFVLVIMVIVLACDTVGAPAVMASEQPSETIESMEKRMDDAAQIGDLDLAVQLARKLVEMERVRGADLNVMAIRLSDLAKLSLAAGDYAGARQPLEEAWQVLDKDRKAADPSLVIQTAIQLGELMAFGGDFKSAKNELEKAVAMAQEYNGEDKPKLLGTAQLRLAQTLDNNNELERSQKLYLEALRLLESAKDADKADLMDCLNNIATQLQSQKKYAEAAEKLERALKLSIELNGEDHPDTAVVMNNLAMLDRSQGQLDKAFPRLEKALAVLRQTMGPEHVSVARVHESLGDIYHLKGDDVSCRIEMLNAAEIVNRHVFQMLPVLSVAEQESFLAVTVPNELSLLLSVCREGKDLNDAYGLILNWKGLLIDSLRRQKMILELRSDPGAAALVTQLETLRGEIAGWYARAGTVSYSEWKKTDDELTAKKESVERQLGSKLRQGGGLFEPELLDLKKLAASLSPDEVLVDIYEYAAFGRADNRHFAAIIFRPSGEAQFVELGAARDVSLLFSNWRNAVLAGHMADNQWQDMKRTLWAPVASKLAGAKKVFLCPDGELSRLPWHLFPCDFENGQVSAYVCEVDSPRELYGLRRVKHHDSSSHLLLAGGIDFDSRPKGVDSKAAIVKLPPLPGTLLEVKCIEEIGRKHNLQIEKLLGTEASKDAILKAIGKCDYVHLATHGFFFDQNYVQAVQDMHEDMKLENQKLEEPGQEKTKPDQKNVLTRSVTILQSSRSKGSRVRQRNPLVESGIAVAGANWREEKTLLNSGYITAEELVGVNLERCSMMTLSACETGRGEEITGQGVMGLRAAIMSTGVRSILMSVWKVPDDATVRLMKAFYENLWVKKMSRCEALIKAQMSLAGDQEVKRFRVPINWSAWILVGDGF